MSYFYRFEYDMILVFSASDRPLAEEFARLLVERNMKLSLAEFEEPDAAAHLAGVFARKARFYILFISQSFPFMNWGEIEQIASQVDEEARKGTTILPVQLDDAQMPGLETTAEMKDLRQHSTMDIVELVTNTIVREKNHPGPPSQSHDLRSGNVPSTKGRNDT